MIRKIFVLFLMLLIVLTSIVIIPSDFEVKAAGGGGGGDNGSAWILADDTVNETTTRMVNSSEQLALDTIFNGIVNTSDLLSSFGSGTYRVYACFRDPDGDVLVCDDQSLMEASYVFTVSAS